MRIGILGGTFNPPHMGHLRLAEEVSDVHGLARVVFVPSHIPPHKDRGEITDSEHRLEMTRAACRNNSRFEVSDLELSIPGTSYTVKTLDRLSREWDAESHFIMGTDSLREIGTWKDYHRLFSLSSFIVVARPGITFDQAWDEVPQSTRAQFSGEDGVFVHASGHRLIASEVRGLDVSSTQIRSLIRNGRSVRYLVPESVLTYLEHQRLYGCTSL